MSFTEFRFGRCRLDVGHGLVHMSTMRSEQFGLIFLSFGEDRTLSAAVRVESELDRAHRHVTSASGEAALDPGPQANQLIAGFRGFLIDLARTYKI